MNKYLVLLICFLSGCASLPKEVTLVEPLPQQQYIRTALLTQHHYLTPEDVLKEIATLRQNQNKLNDWLNEQGWSAWEIQHDIYDSGNFLDAIITSITPLTNEETLVEKERLIVRYEKYLHDYKEYELKKREELESLDKKARSLGVSP